MQSNRLPRTTGTGTSATYYRYTGIHMVRSVTSTASFRSHDQRSYPEHSVWRAGLLSVASPFFKSMGGGSIKMRSWKPISLLVFSRIGNGWAPGAEQPPVVKNQ